MEPDGLHAGLTVQSLYTQTAGGRKQERTSLWSVSDVSTVVDRYCVGVSLFYTSVLKCLFFTILPSRCDFLCLAFVHRCHNQSVPLYVLLQLIRNLKYIMLLIHNVTTAV